MIKLMAVDFFSNGDGSYSGLCVWDLSTLAQLQRGEMFSELFQDFMDGYVKPEGSSH